MVYTGKNHIVELKKMDSEQTKDEIQNLKRLARHSKEPRMKMRYDVIRLHLQGRSKSEIADIIDTTYQTVRNYINAYNKLGIEGLKINKPPGRAKKLTDAQEKQLYDCISTKLPKDVGFDPFANWTAPLACLWALKEFGVKFTERGMRDVFYRLNLSYTCPTYTLKKADLEKQEAFKTDFEDVKKTDFR